MSRLQVV